MATIVTRAGKGSPLTHPEMDANFTNLNNDKLETNLTIVSYDADHSLILTDSYKILECSKGSDFLLGVPNDSTVDFDIGAQIIISQIGIGQIVFTPAEGVTVRTCETLRTAKQYAGATLYKRNTTDWVVFGNLEVA
jgi:hypothetical protein